jgi:hypothetical protein
MQYFDDELQLKTKEDAIRDYENNCIEYVNKQIEINNKEFICTAELLKKRLYPAFVETIKKEFNILCETDELLIINWVYQNWLYKDGE